MNFNFNEFIKLKTKFVLKLKFLFELIKLLKPYYLYGLGLNIYCCKSNLKQ